MRSGADYPGNIVRKLRLVELFSAELPQHLSRATATPRVFGGRYDPRLSYEHHITELAALKLRQADTVSVMAEARSLQPQTNQPQRMAASAARSRSSLSCKRSRSIAARINRDLVAYFGPRIREMRLSISSSIRKHTMEL